MSARYLLWSCFSAALSLVACSDDSGPAGGGGTPETTAGPTTTAGTGTGTSSGQGGAATGSGGGAPTCQGKFGAVGDSDYMLDHDGQSREYRVHAPPGYDGTVGLPVVFVLHGYTETNDQIETITQMTPAADARGYIAVYPQGRSTSWNAGNCCGSSASLGVDDVGFVSAMVDAIDEAYCIDPKRVFAAGFSNGGMLSNRLACELSDRIAAFGPVAGPLAFDGCSPPRPVPMMEFHGTSDFVVPYDGGGLSNAVSVDENVAFWVANNGCGTTPMVTFDKGDATCETYEGCQNDATVTLCTLEGGGHQWPGGESAGPGGEINMDIFASAALLDFFDAHPMP